MLLISTVEEVAGSSVADPHAFGEDSDQVGRLLRIHQNMKDL